MYDDNLQYATIDDIIAANELILDDKKFNSNNAQYNIQKILPIINLGCIDNTDNVLIITETPEIFYYVIPFIYTPKKLTINYSKPENAGNHYQASWDKMKQVLAGYVKVEPELKYSRTFKLKYDIDSYDVIYSYFNLTDYLEDLNEINRFMLKTGDEYETFRNSLISLTHSLRNDGSLILCTKPAWILKTWELLQELGLELEYQGHSYYEHSFRNPNVNVWLRFIKKASTIDIDKQKRNIISLMKDNFIDRLYAHRNNLRFPYVEVSYKNSDTFISYNQNYNNMQYFFSLPTTKKLAELCDNYTACLVTPSIAKYAHTLNKKVVLFECDNRFRENKGFKFVKYDLNKGLTVVNKSKYANKFHTVICDPPFNVNLDYLARDILELIIKKTASIAYIVFPDSRKTSLINAMKKQGFINQDIDEEIIIEYAKPPKIVRVNGKKAIGLLKFVIHSS